MLMLSELIYLDVFSFIGKVPAALFSLFQLIFSVVCNIVITFENTEQKYLIWKSFLIL
jgi:hypothetical protein